jgi:hypothetical protein
MDDPIKIIHKFKNNNRRIQYNIYIYLGSIVSEEIQKVLNIIKNKDFFNTLITLSKKQYELLEQYYGLRWYEKFFISYHINNEIKNIINSPPKKKQIELKYGKDWYKIHIIADNITKLSYTFAFNYYSNLLDKKKKTISKKNEIDFRTYNQNKQIGGFDEEVEDIIDYTDDLNPENVDEEEETEIEESELEELIEEDFNLDEITKLYADETIETDKTIKEISQLISTATNDKKWEKKIEDIELKYDESLEGITFDAKLENVFNKNYIYDEYIFKDDTVKTLKQKISITMPLSTKFKDLKLLPESIYLWSEYYTANGKDEIMLGHKWIRRNELLKIDIIPNENLNIYENLRNNLGYLKDAFGYKIKREDDDTNIIDFYNTYMTMNEIFMLDIYNDLGINYNSLPEKKKNLFEVYVNIYYPLIIYDRFENIIQYLNNANDNEIKYINNKFIIIKNDCRLEKEIYLTVENAKVHVKKYDSLFMPNHIIQCNIHVNINDPRNITGTTIENKFNLYRIFDNFIVSPEYPFMEFQSQDKHGSYKIYTTSNNKLNNQDIFSKWFLSTNYGLGFKIFINNKYIVINLYESGRIEYKITWKEDDAAKMEDIIKTYEYVRNLLNKINSENTKVKFILPSDDKFIYAFINTIQKFTIPENFKINHNDLSDFSRFFFPYISLVVEPKKRESKINIEKSKTSKFGTYLRYKRINKYENRIKMHFRILYFLRNFEINDKELIDEIAKQFNITEEYAVKEIDFVKNKYGHVIKRSKKLLKKLKLLPKNVKPPGIGIDIQGRDRDKYKIRITGARNKEQLEKITTFLKILIFLYTETYLYKNKKYVNLKQTLKLLTKIASRRNKVVDIANYDVEKSKVKIITSLDKERLGFKPVKGQSQWTRSCQNSADVKRRPTVVQENNLEELLKAGYKLNPKTNIYEKEVQITLKKKKHNVTLKAVKLASDSTYNFYTCDPSENNDYMYIGFLARGNNPSDLCMPCCFKKDQSQSVNKAKKNYYLKCIGEKLQQSTNIVANLGEKLYILQETNKIQNNRFIFLPKYLDIFFNQLWNHEKKIKNHYLYESKTGYFFKYTIKDDEQTFVAALANIFGKTNEDMINLIIKFIEEDADDKFFTFLNNGDIKEMFKTKEHYINFIKSTKNISYDYIGELASIPNLLTKNGIYFFILEKNNLIIKKNLEKDKIIERYYLNCLNFENNYMMSENRDFIILIKDGINYFPIYYVRKDLKIDKKIYLKKIFDYTGYESKILDEMKNYYGKSCNMALINKISGNNLLFAKNIINKLDNIKCVQYIDYRSKCKYLELDNIIIPVYSSGISYNFKFEYLKQLEDDKLQNIEKTITELNNINKILNLNYIPKIIFYNKIEDDNINIVSLLLENNLILPIKSTILKIEDTKKYGLPIKFQPLEEVVDKAIINNLKIIDHRYTRVRTHLYKNESYNIYKLELSNYLQNHPDIKEKIINIVRNSKLGLYDKKNELRKILFKIISSKLSKELKQQSAGGDTMAHIEKDLPDVNKYIISNARDYCNSNKNKDTCDTNLHCSWKKDECKLRLTDNLAIDFVNKVIEDIVQNNIQFKELIQENTYYVSDIVSQNQYTSRDNQIIIKTSNFNLNKIINELFDQPPTIGKRKIKNENKENEIEEDYKELMEIGKQLIQPIISNKDSVIRAFVNCYYWINNPLYDKDSRNLGYYSEFQSLLTNQYKAKIIDFIQNVINDKELLKKHEKYLNKYIEKKSNFFDSALNKFRKLSYNTTGILELYILSFIVESRIIVYNNYNKIEYLFLQGDVEINSENIKTFTKEEFRNKTIYIKFDYEGTNKIPINIYSIYYL